MADTHPSGIRKIKDAIYDAEIGEAEIMRSQKDPNDYVVRFDTRTKNVGAVLLNTDMNYQDMVNSLRKAHDDR
ncbi:MAG: hypothetical protein JSR89_01730 [Proteobacteria bacterium]|nr:hypothetical protein [Pseudomonadota bacterium]